MSETRNFGRWLKKLRAEQDLTQETLSELIGCAPTTVRSFEIGKRRPSREMVERIADVLNVPADQRGEFVRLARLPMADEPSEAEPLVQSAAPEQLTISVSRVPPPDLLIGREAEINTLKQLLQHERLRLVTIVGPGGMGKTRLAQQVAAECGAHFRDGAAFVSLAAVADGQNVPTTIADSLGLSLQQAIDVPERVLQLLADRQQLVVLDNFEHLLTTTEAQATAIDFIQNILQRSQGVHMLVTSRERLRIGRERTFELGGLATPKQQSVEESDAVLLFIERAQQVTGNFALTAENRSDVARICNLLDGMPLAIELAASWVRVLSCDEIADEIQRSLDFLALADRDMTPRHRSMRAVFDHSWSLLTLMEQQSMAQLAIFADGCRRNAAQVVAGATLPMLATLIDKSLIEKRQQGASTRYVMHELVRQYSLLHLQQRGEEVATRRRHALYYLDLVEQAQPHLRAANQVEWLARLSEEHDNLRLVLAWSLQQGEIEIAARIVCSLSQFWWIRNYIIEGRRWAEEVLAHQEQLPLALRIRVTMATIVIVVPLADAKVVEHYALELQALSQQAGGDPHADAYVSTNISFAAFLRGDMAQCLPKIDAARRLFHQEGDLPLASQAETWTGITYLRLGDDDHALTHFEAGLVCAQQIGDRLGSTNAHYYLGELALLRHQPAVAKEHFRAAIPPAQEMGDRANIAYMLEGLAVAAGSEGNHAHAAQLFGAAHGLLQRIGLSTGTYYYPDREHYTAIRRQVEQALGNQYFQQLWAEGRSLGLEEMIGLADD